MSGSESGDGTVAGPTSRTDERLSRLFAELQDGQADEGFGGRGPQQPEALLETILGTVGSDSSFEFDQGVVKQSLDELLVLLIAMRSEKSNGKALMADLSELFDSDLSPGTVYPTLHELENDGKLEMFELVRSKEYRVDDREQAAAMVDAAARQHLALGAFLHAAATEL